MSDYTLAEKFYATWPSLAGPLYVGTTSFVAIEYTDSIDWASDKSTFLADVCLANFILGGLALFTSVLFSAEIPDRLKKAKKLRGLQRKHRTLEIEPDGTKVIVTVKERAPNKPPSKLWPLTLAEDDAYYSSSDRRVFDTEIPGEDQAAHEYVREIKDRFDSYGKQVKAAPEARALAEALKK